jgi:enoyl-CoA hydratase/carnithine racemase
MTDTDELLARDDGAVRLLTLNRPASKNGLTVDVNRRMIEALDAAAADRAVRCVLLTGAGGSFCSGLDLKMAAVQSSEPGDIAHRMDNYFHGLIRAVRRVEKPVIALVDGTAVGFGCDLALACDLRLGTPRTRFGEIFVKRGLMPDGGGSYHLPRLVGTAKAIELMLTGDFVDADEALRLGLVTRLLPQESALDDALAFARKLADGAPRVHVWIKRAVYGALDGTLEDALAIERQGQLELLKSRDFFEGVSAFFQKRAPKFTGE